MKEIKIYSLRAINSNEIRYIGYTTLTLEQRLNKHKLNVREAFERKTRKINKRLSWLKSINCEVLIELIDIAKEKDIKWIETFYIQLFKSWNFKLTNGTDGGDGGDTFSKLSEERKQAVRQKLSKINKGKKLKPLSEEHKQKLRDNHSIKNGRTKPWNLNKKATDEQRKKLSLAKLGKSSHQLNKSSYGKIQKLTLNDEFIEEFENPCFAARSLNLKTKLNYIAGNIIKCCKGKFKKSYNFKWKFII